MNTFHLPVAAVAFGFWLGCGGFIFTGPCLYAPNICCYVVFKWAIIFWGDTKTNYSRSQLLRQGAKIFLAIISLVNLK
jgi:hypothetical protein